MSTDLITTELARIGEAANQAAARHALADYRSRKAANTLRRQDAGLALFAEYLADVAGLEVGDLAHDPAAWQGITWGLVTAFQKWMLERSYAVTSVNVQLSTLKVYAKQAFKAGALSDTDYAFIKSVSGYSRKEAIEIDKKRAAVDLPTRMGRKKAEPVSITRDQANALKEQPDTPQGRRDRLLMHLLLDLGLRVGEVAWLTVANFDLKAGELVFYRPKVDKVQTHRLINGTLDAARAYLEHDALAVGPLMRGSRKDGRLNEAGWSERNITERVKTLGEAVDLQGLSAHDCRHYWATTASRHGTDPFALQEAGGWSSLAMPRRYIEAARIANQGVRLE